MDTDDTPTTDLDDDRLLLLDRIADRMPDVNLDDHEVSWTALPDGAPALLVDGGGFDGETGCCFANAGDDVHVIGPIPSFAAIGAVVVRPDGTRILARVERDPLAQPPAPEPE